MAYEQGIQDFYRIAQETGFTRDFQLRIIAWNVLNNVQDLNETALVMLRTAALPSMVTTVNQVPFMGLDFNLPGTTKFPGSQAWNVEFYYQQDLSRVGYSFPSLREHFISTMLGNFDFEETSTGNLQLPDKSNNFIEIAVVDDKLEDISNYTLHGAFITQVGDVAFDLTGAGAVQKIPLTIAYQYWTNDLSFANPER